LKKLNISDTESSLYHIALGSWWRMSCCTSIEKFMFLELHLSFLSTTMLTLSTLRGSFLSLYASDTFSWSFPFLEAINKFIYTSSELGCFQHLQMGRMANMRQIVTIALPTHFTISVWGLRLKKLTVSIHPSFTKIG